MPVHQIVGLSFALLGLVVSAVLALESRRARSLDLARLPITAPLMWIVRITVGVLFIYSGFVKANDYIGFAYKLEEYFIVFGQHFSFAKGFFDLFIPIAGPMAWFISVFEIALAVAIIVGWRMNLTAWLTLLMMVFFTILTGYSHVTGAVTDCGCFGDALHLEPWESFMKDIILMLVLVPLFLVRKSIKPFPNGKVAAIATGATFLITGIFSYYCHENLPVVDYRPYKLGVDLNVCTTEIGPDGYSKCKDWDIYFPDGGDFPVLQGNTLMIIVYDLEKAPEAALQQAIALSKELTATTDIRPVLTTATPSRVTREIITKLGLEAPFMLMDQTVLKTIIRSHPGYMLLNNGVVKNKWHYNNTPDVAELKAAL